MKKYTNLNTDEEEQLDNQIISKAPHLKWSDHEQDILLRGESDLATLKGIRNVIINLQKEFGSQGRHNVKFDDSRKDEFGKRLLLLEGEVQGLLKKRINYSQGNPALGGRVLDYSNILNEKENQIVELQRKIVNLQDRLRRANKKQIELQNHIQYLVKLLQQNQDIIHGKNSINLAQVAANNLIQSSMTKVKKNQDINSSIIGEFHRIVEVPVQDARTKHLLHVFANELKKLFIKYPKLQGEMDQRLVEFFQQEIVDLIEVDEVDRLVQIVKYKPHVVKVENVYASNNEKSRRVQFHLRVLIKALLEQLQKIKAKSGIVLAMDEGIVSMIRQQIMDVVNIDDILKVFRVVPKIVEVEKIIQKVVQKIVQVPQIVTVDRIVQKVVQVQKIKQVDRVVNVPLEQPVVYQRMIEKVVPIQNIVQRIVQVPTTVERLVQVLKEVPKIVQVEKIQQKIVEVEKIVQVQRVVNHVEKQYQEVELIKQKIVPVEKMVQIIRQVPIIVQKIVQKIIQVPKIIEIQKIVQKIVPVKEYIPAKQVMNHIQIQYEVVQRVVEKPIPIIQTIEKILQIPQVVQKIVQLVNIETQIQQVQVIVQKIVYKQKIKQIDKQIPKIVQLIKQVPREIEKIVQVPFIHEKIIVIPQYAQRPVVQKIQNTIVKQVYVRDPLVIKQPQIVQVQKIINHYIQVPKPFKYIEQKIVEVPIIMDRIKEVRVQVDKIIQKMVEVPKIVEVEKQVQKIVTVPRVIEKVIEIPQIIQKVVQKEIIKEVIKEVERVVQVPIFEEKPVEVQVQNNVYIQVEKIVQKIVQKLVEVPKIQRIVEIHDVVQEKVIEVIKEIPKMLEIQKIVALYVQQTKVIQIPNPIIVPVQIPVIKDRIIEKLVTLDNSIERVVQVPQVIQKIVHVRSEQAIIHQIQKIVQKVVVNEKIKQIERIVPYIQQVIKQIPTIIEKIVPIQSKIQQIVTAQQIVQKVIEKTITIPKVFEVEKAYEVIRQVPKFIQIQRIVPKIQKVNHYIQKIVEKIVEVPVIMEKLNVIEKQVEKVVSIYDKATHIVEVQKQIEKIVFMEKIKEVVKNVNHIEKVLQIVDKLQQIPVEVTSRQEILVEVPYILQKIVEKIVIMPQIVQVLKYVHQITQVQDIGVAIDAETSTYEQKYKIISKNIKNQLDTLLKELRSMRNPQLQIKITVIQKFLSQFEKFILNPRIIKIPQKQIVQKQIEVEKIVKIPTRDEKSVKIELALSLLVQKLIMELKRIKENNRIDLQLDQEIKLIFFPQLRTRSQLQGVFEQQIKSYSDKVMRQFESLGNWSLDHQLMLNSFLQERFLMAQIVYNANLEIEKAVAIAERRLEGLRKYKNERNIFAGFLNQISQIVRDTPSEFIDKIPKIQDILIKFEQDFISEGVSNRTSYISPEKTHPNAMRGVKFTQSILKPQNTFYSSTEKHQSIKKFETTGKKLNEPKYDNAYGFNSNKSSPPTREWKIEDSRKYQSSHHKQ